MTEVRVPCWGRQWTRRAEETINELENMSTETYRNVIFQQKGKEKKKGKNRRSMGFGTVSKGVTHVWWKYQKEKEGKTEWKTYLRCCWPRTSQNQCHQTTDPGSPLGVEQATPHATHTRACCAGAAEHSKTTGKRERSQE